MICVKLHLSCFRIVITLLVWTLISPFIARAETPNATHRLAINFNEAMNRCLQSSCSNIEEIMGFFSDDSSYLDDAGQLWNGKTDIRRNFTRTTAQSDTSDRIEGLDVYENMVTLRLQRRRIFKTGKYDAAEIKPHMQIMVLRGDKIVRLLSVIPLNK